MIFSVEFGRRPKCPALLPSPTGFEAPGFLLSKKQLDLFSQMRKPALSPSLHGWCYTDANKWPFTFHFHVNQPLGINRKIPTVSVCKRTQEETHWALQSRTHWLGWFSICSTIKKVCMASQDCSLFASIPLLQGNHESLFRIH